MPRENDVVTGAGNSAFAEMAGEGPAATGSSNKTNTIEKQNPSIGRQEGQATIRTDKNLDREIDEANAKSRDSRGSETHPVDRDHDVNPNAYRDNYKKENSF